MQNLRSPIISVLGHVDHGKSSILDAIRGTNILATEPGQITQAIGASIIPLAVIKKKCGALLEKLHMDFTIPGLLFIDTPGHAAFTSLRKRGGNLADIAIVVIDINEGFKPQTLEAIEILRSYKTPFVIAANKIDLLPGYRKKSEQFLADLAGQDARFQEILETKLYQIVGDLHAKFQMQAERFDRTDFLTQVAIIPVSAKQNVGIPELLMVLTGLSQKYLEDNLKLEVQGPAKGTILEVKEEKGLGTTLDIIIFDGTLHVNDTIVIGGIEAPLVSKVRAILLPNPLEEMRDKKAKYRHVKEVVAAVGVKVSAPELKEVIAGMPVISATEESLAEVKEAVQKEVEEVLIRTERDGIIIKGDNLGSLEALSNLLKEKGISIRKASVGEISKKDISEAESNYEKDPLSAVILGFNIPQAESTEKVKVITHNIIYKLIDEYLSWMEQEKKVLEAKELDLLVRPAKIEVLRNCIFRQSNPCIVGIEVLSGVLKQGTGLMKDGKNIGTVKSMQSEKESLNKVEKGKQCAISIPDATAGRQINEGDILYSVIPEEHFRKIKKLVKYLTESEKSTLREIADIYRKQNVVWGV
ncbi:MAG: translation initiation factor IF-2 [Nanoarchaeota archaeon]